MKFSDVFKRQSDHDATLVLAQELCTGLGNTLWKLCIQCLQFTLHIYLLSAIRWGVLKRIKHFGLPTTSLKFLESTPRISDMV